MGRRCGKAHPFPAVFGKRLDILGMQCGGLGTCIDLDGKIQQVHLGQADAFMPADDGIGLRQLGGRGFHTGVVHKGA